MYGLEFSIKSFAVANELTTTLNKICYKLGTQLTPFCLFADEYQKNHNVLDLMQLGSLNGSGLSLVDDIAKYRQDTYNIYGKPFDSLDEQERRNLCIDYLLSTSICYMESEAWKTVAGVATPTYDKMLATRNPAIMSAWMGSSTDEMQRKYSGRIKLDRGELNAHIIRYVKLNSTAKGNSITVPRRYVSTIKTRCVPLFMLYAWIEGVKTVMKENIVKFTFLKDNRTERELCSTLSETIIRKYYNDNNFIASMLNGIDLDQNVQGGMHLPTKIHRGYIKIPELGSSVYDNGTRSLNLARVLKTETVTEIDTTFINVSLDSVLDNFRRNVEDIRLKQPELLADIYRELTQEEPVVNDNISIVARLEKYITDKDMIFTTSFRRSLHLFMISHQHWFPRYTGVPFQTAVSSTPVIENGYLDF